MTKNYLDILAETIRNNWDQPALTDFYLTEDGKSQDTSRGNHYTYGEMYEEIVRVADLLTNLGLQKGDHIAICGANSSHWVIAYLAIAKMQGVSVTVMHSILSDEIARLIDFSDAKALFVDEELWEELKEQPLLQIESVIALDNWDVLRGNNDVRINHQLPITNDQCQFVHGNPDELAMICFTSGSSGNPKGVMLSYRNVNTCVKVVESTFPICSNRNAIAILPLSHFFGLAYPLIALVDHAYVHIPVEEGMNTIYEAIRKIRPYVIAIVPQMIPLLFRNDNYSYIEYIVSGGAEASPTIVESLRLQSLPVTVGYGSVEASASISMVAPELYKFKSSGRIVETLKCRIAPNGEILVKGENVMLGYYKDPEATAQKIDKDGWLHTGDKGYLDEDGYLYVEGRLEQDIIVLPNGENIRPDNIEVLINALPEVKESIVLARDGKLVAIVVPQIINHKSEITNADLRRSILRAINPQLPLFSQLYDVEITNLPLARTEKQTLKRYLYR